MAKILATLGANNDDLYNRIRKLEAEVVKTGLKADFYIKEYNTNIKELKSDINDVKYVFQEKFAKYTVNSMVPTKRSGPPTSILGPSSLY
jgi:hypothetical protein